jgi:hypothetical protein
MKKSRQGDLIFLLPLANVQVDKAPSESEEIFEWDEPFADQADNSPLSCPTDSSAWMKASSLLKISKGTLCNWLSSGRHGLQRVKVSGRTHVDRLQIEALLEKSLGASVD